MHVGIPFAPTGCRLVCIWPVSTGVGFRGRWVMIYERASKRGCCESRRRRRRDLSGRSLQP